MRWIALLLALWCCTACRPKAAQPSSEPKSAPAKVPYKPPNVVDPASGLARFADTVGHLDDGSEFLAFIDAHEGKPVTLDLKLTIGDDDRGEDSEISWFVIFDECPNLAEGEKPKSLACSGFEFNIPYKPGSGRPLVKEGDAWRLRGNFRPVPAGGPLQGLMAVSLEPVASEAGGNR